MLNISLFQIIAVNHYLRIYNSQTFELEYENDVYEPTDVEVGDVDGDNVNEIILSDGYILDGETFEEEWHYVGGFGWFVELGKVNDDTIPEIISSSSGYITAFDGTLHSPLWQFSTGYYGGCDALKVYDIGGDGTDEILYGSDDFSVAIACFSASTQNLLWENTDENSGITNIGIGDADDDGIVEFIWGSGIGSTAGDYLHIAGFDNYQTKWKSHCFGGPFYVNTCDVNNDDTLEIIGSCYDSDNGYEGGIFFTYNSITHQQLNYFETNSFYGIDGMATNNINDTENAEIVISIDGYIYVFDAVTFDQIWVSSSIGSTYSIQLEDIDLDGDIEIVFGTYQGYIYVLNGKTFEQEWKSISTGGQIGDIEIANCDEDDALEIVFNNYKGIIQMYDGINHNLEWQSAELNNITALDVCDYNRDGIMDIISGDYYGDIVITKCDDFSVAGSFNAFDNEIYGLKVDNIDSTNQLEIIVGSDVLKIFNASDFELIWESENLGNYVGNNNNILVIDTDDDQYKEVLIGTSWGIFQFESNTPYLDTNPPKVLWGTPTDGMVNVGTNNIIEAQFSELIDESSLNENTLEISSENSGQIEFTFTFDTINNKITLSPVSDLPAEEEITVWFSASIADTSWK